MPIKPLTNNLDFSDLYDHDILQVLTTSVGPMSKAVDLGRMQFSRGRSLPKIISVVGSCRFICSTAPRALNRKWRKSLGLAQNPNAFGPLTNLPDYTYMDERLTPMGMNMMRRLERQSNAAREIVAKIQEVDFAKQRYTQVQQVQQNQRQQHISSKMIPKGALLLRK